MFSEISPRRPLTSLGFTRPDFQDLDNKPRPGGRSRLPRLQMSPLTGAGLDQPQVQHIADHRRSNSKSPCLIPFSPRPLQLPKRQCGPLLRHMRSQVSLHRGGPRLFSCPPHHVCLLMLVSHVGRVLYPRTHMEPVFF